MNEENHEYSDIPQLEPAFNLAHLRRLALFVTVLMTLAGVAMLIWR